MVEVQVPKDRKVKMMIDLLAKYVAEVRCCCSVGAGSTTAAKSALPLSLLIYTISPLLHQAGWKDRCRCFSWGVLQEGHVFEQQVMEKFPPDSGGVEVVWLSD